MTRNLKLLISFVWKFMGTVRFGNDHVDLILGYEDLQWGNILIAQVYFAEVLGHNLLSVGQFYYSDLEVTFRRNTCFIRNLEGVDMLKGYHTTNLYTINLQEMASASPIRLMARATSTKPMRVGSINEKRYVLVIVDDYSHYTWVHFLRSKDEAPENDREDIEKLGAKGTDNAKIARKRSKPDKHGHGKGKRIQEPEEYYQ
ncbi:hypothetical protein Tco_1490256, partial [Tanacetum coccineum]